MNYKMEGIRLEQLFERSLARTGFVIDGADSVQGKTGSFKSRAGTPLVSKRIFDIAFAATAIVMLAPIMLAIVLLIKLDSRGPVLFKQRRNGLNNKVIEVWKFRSMSVLENGRTMKQATVNDPRVTRIGAILRKYSLDELPQFFNVLYGSMSIVGPRPHAIAHNREFADLIEDFDKRHNVKPGITGLAQINGARGETDTLNKMALRVAFDLAYISNWSLKMDIQIIIKTVFDCAKTDQAY